MNLVSKQFTSTAALDKANRNLKQHGIGPKLKREFRNTKTSPGLHRNFKL